MQAPITVFTQGAKRESGKKAQFGNIMAAKVRIRESGRRKARLRRKQNLFGVTDRLPIAHASLSLSLSKTPSQAVADIVRTTLGPRAMLKMLLDASGGKMKCFKMGGEEE